MSEKLEEQNIRSLTPIEHILKRAEMYLGSMTPQEKAVWIFDSDDKLHFKGTVYTEGLLKVVNEVIDNCIDEHIRTKFTFATKVNITIDDTTCTIEDNGRGIPVEQNENGEWVCVNAACRPMTSGNYDDDANRKTIGLNGLGLKGANIFSKHFECITCNGGKKMQIVCNDNLSSEEHMLLRASSKSGTLVTFQPDFKRFGVKKFDSVIISLLKTRLKILSWFFPECNIMLNGEKINMKVKDISAMFPEPSVVFSNDNVYICAYPSEEPAVLTYVNGMYMTRNGSHIDYILGKIVDGIRDGVSKKFKTIKPADIRNRLGLVVFLKNFQNCTFDSQTKDMLTNSQASIGEYLRANEVDIDGMVAKILKTKDIVNNITELFRLKEELAERKALEKANTKTRREFESEKYFPPVGKTARKYLMIVEGFSAFSGISPILGRQGIGYYMLRGKPENVYGEKAIEFMKNKEVNDLVHILNIDLSNPETDMTYDYVVVLSDQDADGVLINGLVLNLFNCIAPRMIREGRVCRLETPLLLGLKGETVEEFYFSFPKKSDMKKSLHYDYIKGLGGWNKDKFQQVLDKVGGLEKLFVYYEVDKSINESFEVWFGKSSDLRKERLKGLEFHIDDI